MRKSLSLLVIFICLITFHFSFGQKKQTKVARDERNKLSLASQINMDVRKQAFKELTDFYPDTNKFVLIDYVFKQYRCEKELNMLLAKYNMTIDSVFYYYNRTVNHFEDEDEIAAKTAKMEARIVQKYGENFIDSLVKIADRQYVMSNSDKIYDYYDCDTVPIYAKSKYYRQSNTDYKKDFWSKVKYPKDYIFRAEQELYSHIEADFILDKKGQVSTIKTRLSFHNTFNTRFESYFRKKLIRFIKKSKWKPATSAGMIVNSYVRLVIHFN